MKRVRIVVGSSRNSHEQILQFTLHAQSCLAEETTSGIFHFNSMQTVKRTTCLATPIHMCVCVAEPAHVIHPKLAVVSIDTLCLVRHPFGQG